MSDESKSSALSERLASYRTLRAGITPGPWTAQRTSVFPLVVRGQYIVAETRRDIDTLNDARFIAAAPQIADDCLALAEENARLREVLAKFVDEEECRLDHHGNCQEHSLGNPCEVAEARKLLAGLGWSAP